MRESRRASVSSMSSPSAELGTESAGAPLEARNARICSRPPVTAPVTTPTPVTATRAIARPARRAASRSRSEEHTSELQSLAYLVCRLLLEKKKKEHDASIL